MFLPSILNFTAFHFSATKIKRFCVFVIALTVLGLVICCVAFFITADHTNATSESIPRKWYTAKPRTAEPWLFSKYEAFQEVPNLPTAYLNPNFSRDEYRMNETCAPYPDVFQLAFHNEYWQLLPLSTNRWYVFAAYYENRWHSDVKPAVRLTVAIDLFDPTEYPFCQIWFPRHKQPVIVPIRKPNFVHKTKKPGFNAFFNETVAIYLITCAIPKEHASSIPDSVSLVERECDTAKNHLKVIYNKAKKKHDFAVCVTALTFVSLDYSVRIAEWIELVRLLGAHQIFMYYHHHHENVSKVLKHYEEKGEIELYRFSLADDQPNLPMLQSLYLTGMGEYMTSQRIALQDCLYRNMYNYEYIAVIDVDEVIVPVEQTTWGEMMEKIKPKIRNRSMFFCFKNFWFHDDDTYPGLNYTDVPNYLHMLRHVHRTEKDYTRGRGAYGWHTKCINKPELIKIQGDHTPLVCFGTCRKYTLPSSKAKLQHYCDQHLRNRCIDKVNPSMNDTSIWKYKKALIGRLLPTLHQLGFLGS